LTLAKKLGPPEKSANLAGRSVTRYTFAIIKEDAVTAAAERMKALRERRKANHLREVRIVALDARSPEVRKQIAEQVAALNKDEEREILEWTEKAADLSGWTWPE